MSEDVFVIGGGPAGLAAAIAARRKGFRVTVADGRCPPIDKACGEGLLPPAVAAAHALGLDLDSAESFALRGVRFHEGNVSVASDFANGRALGVRRTALHAALVERARSVGVELRWGCPVAALDSIRARYVIGADGMSSRVRGWAGLDAVARDSRRYGFRRHYSIAPWSSYVETYWGDGVQAYVTPIGPDQVGVAILSRDPKLRVDQALDRFPDLRARLRGAPVASAERGGLTPTRRLRRVTRANVALVGDASGSVDAITGEGIALGFEQALALAEAMQTGDLSEYQRAHNRIARRPRFMGDFMLTMDRWPAVRRRAMAAMAARPQLFEGLVAMHTGDLRPAAFAATCAALGWGMLADAAICTSAAWHIKLWARCLTRLTAASANRPR